MLLQLCKKVSLTIIYLPDAYLLLLVASKKYKIMVSSFHNGGYILSSGAEFYDSVT